MRNFYVYIMASYRGTLYVGVTNNLPRRVLEHKLGLTRGFTQHYRVHNLVYYEQANEAAVAIGREKQIKGWTRIKKVRLIEAMNPHWEDLSREFVDVTAVEPPSHREADPAPPQVLRSPTRSG